MTWLRTLARLARRRKPSAPDTGKWPRLTPEEQAVERATALTAGQAREHLK